MIKAVIFDLDDTLISEKDYIKSGYRYISKILSERLDRDEYELFHSLWRLFEQSAERVFNRLFEKYDIPFEEEEILELVALYRNHLPDIKFFEDVLPCLSNLKAANIKVGIITDGYANGQRLKLQATNAEDIFDEIVVTDELGKYFWKPHPKAFEIIKEKLDIDFNQMIYVGDNPKKDFYIGCIYPIKTVRIVRSTGVYQYSSYYNDQKEHFRVNNLFEIIEYIDRLPTV